MAVLLVLTSQSVGPVWSPWQAGLLKGYLLLLLLVILALCRYGRRLDAALDADGEATLRSTFNSIAEPMIVLERDCSIREINWYGELRFPGSLPGDRVCETPVLRRESCDGCPVGACFEQNRPQFFTAESPASTGFGGSERRLDFTAIPIAMSGGLTERLVLRLKMFRGDPVDSVNQQRLDFLGDVVAAVPEAVVGLDRSLRVTAVNPQGEALLGVSQQAALGLQVLKLFQFLEPADHQRFERFLARDEKAEQEVTLKSAEGHAVRAVIAADPLHGADGVRTGTALIVRDVTESRGFQELLRQSEKMSSLGLFMSGLAHELNNPVTAMLGAARTLEQSAKQGALGQREHLDAVAAVAHHAERCSRVVGSLLRLARKEHSGMRRIELSEVVADTMELLDRSLDRERIRLEVRSEPDVPAVHGDPAQLQQALMNLIANARDSICEQNRGGTIRISTRSENGFCQIEVEDDGQGFQAGIGPELFREFVTTKPAGQGTGLGLFLSRAIVREHGGTLEARRRQPRGASFTISLPALIGSKAPEASEASAAALGGSQETPVGLSLLVVDDEHDIGRFLGMCLRNLGHRVTVLEKPLEARALLLSGTPFDLVFSDSCMPELSGSDLYRQVVDRLPAYRGRFVFVIGDTFGGAELPLDEGNGLLHKPFSVDQLEQAMIVRA